MKPVKSAADYAAIAVAPLLIFVMISSLANFLMLILYHGAFPQRVSWTLQMFTLGAVGIARVAIERDRAYALGYAGILGFVAYLSMLRFVDSPIFSAFILIVIAYLSDVIVRDCTLIDDSVDASGQGLIDAGRLFVKQQLDQGDGDADDAPEASAAARASPRAATHQPGRTVLYLALAALPLFGIGQFFLHNDPNTWARAQWLLALYLFASLSLLVTTSFLGLRRYLRQRRVEMPGDVSIGWLAGGIAMIACILLMAFLAPLPGQALATLELPELLDSPGGTEASDYGWGNEGADKSQPEAPATANDPNADRKQVERITPQQGAPAGDAGQGQRDQGPPGSQDGGKQQPGASGEGSPKEDSSTDNSPSANSPPPQPSGEPSGETPSGTTPSGQQSPSPPPASPDSTQQASSTKTDASTGQPEGAEEGQQQSGQAADQPAADSRSTGPESASPASAEPSPPSSPGMMESISQTLPALGSLVKLVIFLVLFGVLAAFLWLHRHWIAQWWQRLLGGQDPVPHDSADDFVDAESAVPQRRFASFRNPLGKEADASRVVVLTFQALDAWTREHGTPRAKDETPAEFIRRLEKSSPQISPTASRLVDAYNRIVFGRGQATSADLDAARQLWQLMQATL